MSMRTPKPITVKRIWVSHHPFSRVTEFEEKGAEFDRMIAEVKAQAWDEGCKAEAGAGLFELLANPYRGEQA